MEQESRDLELKLIPLYAMFRFKEKSAHLMTTGCRRSTAYMDQFALADATSAISLLVDNEGGDLTTIAAKGQEEVCRSRVMARTTNWKKMMKMTTTTITMITMTMTLCHESWSRQM